MWFYVKQSFIAFIYLFFSAIIGFGILCIGDNLIWLKVALLVLNLGLYIVVVGATVYKDGQDALKTRIANDLERMQIIKTGEDRPLRLKEEYKAWKGFVFGLVACIPLVFLMILHTVLILGFGANYNGAGAIAGIAYLVVFAFCRVNTAITITAGMYYFSLLAIPVICLTTGLAYVLGAKKIELQQERIKEKQRQIYGGKI